LDVHSFLYRENSRKFGCEDNKKGRRAQAHLPICYLLIKPNSIEVIRLVWPDNKALHIGCIGPDFLFIVHVDVRRIINQDLVCLFVDFVTLVKIAD
jgi:hypothetical protein